MDIVPLLLAYVAILVLGVRSRDGWVIALAILALLFTVAPRLMP